MEELHIPAEGASCELSAPSSLSNGVAGGDGASSARGTACQTAHDETVQIVDSGSHVKGTVGSSGARLHVAPLSANDASSTTIANSRRNSGLSIEVARQSVDSSTGTEAPTPQRQMLSKRMTNKFGAPLVQLRNYFEREAKQRQQRRGEHGVIA